MLLKLVDQPEVTLSIINEDSVNSWIRMSSVAHYEVSHPGNKAINNGMLLSYSITLTNI
jgi:hypothetical protein